MSRRAVVTSSAPPPAGTYSQAIRSDGPLVFISGRTPRARDRQRLIGAPLEQQARAALDNLEATAQAGGLSFRHAVKVDVFPRDLADRVTFDAIHAGYIGEPPPARALVQSAFTEFDVEVSAALLDQDGTGRTDRPGSADPLGRCQRMRRLRKTAFGAKRPFTRKLTSEMWQTAK